MPDQKMQITDEQFSDFTGTMFNAPFTNSVSDAPLSERKQSRLTACFRAQPAGDSDTSGSNPLDKVNDMYGTVGWHSPFLTGITAAQIDDTSVAALDNGTIDFLKKGQTNATLTIQGMDVKYRLIVSSIADGGNGQPVQKYNAGMKVGDHVDLSSFPDVQINDPTIATLKDGVVTFDKPGNLVITAMNFTGQLSEYDYALA